MGGGSGGQGGAVNERKCGQHANGWLINSAGATKTGAWLSSAGSRPSKGPSAAGTTEAAGPWGLVAP